ncbi:MAG: amino acid permease [Polyangiaceae bacterium]|nr:amino acid permease [Polyangiaceae bacterium]
MLSKNAAPRRRLGLFDVLCIGVNATVGSGVFALPDDMQRQMGGWSPLAFALCAVLLLPVTLCFAELAGRHEDTGGPYLYARGAFGEGVGFIIGWFCWVTAFVSWAANTTVLVELVGLRGAANKAVCVGLVAALGAINYVGVKPGAWVVNAVTIGKLAAIFCFLGVAVFAMDVSRLGGALPRGIQGVGQGVYLALFPLQGFEVAPVPAGETANPRRNVPLGTVGALVFSAALFVVVQAALAASYAGLAGESGTPLVDAAARMGPGIGVVVLVGSLVSIGGFTAGSALGSPRYAQAIARHGLLPGALARIHPRWETPHVAIALTTAFAAGLALLFDYRQLVGMANVTVVVQYACTCLAVPALRRKPGPRGGGGWVVPGGSVIPYLGAAGSIALLSGAERSELAFAGVTLLVGVGIARASARWGGGAKSA